MTREENDIMRDAFYYLRDHNNPPAPGTDQAQAFWQKAAKDASDLVGKTWNNHPLAVSVMLGIYGYLEKKGQQEASDDS